VQGHLDVARRKSTPAFTRKFFYQVWRLVTAIAKQMQGRARQATGTAILATAGDPTFKQYVIGNAFDDRRDR
jgi:hypothetical protein